MLLEPYLAGFRQHNNDSKRVATGGRLRRAPAPAAYV